MKIIFILLAVISLSIRLYSQPVLDGEWNGKISIISLGFCKVVSC